MTQFLILINVGLDLKLWCCGLFLKTKTSTDIEHVKAEALTALPQKLYILMIK